MSDDQPATAGQHPHLRHADGGGPAPRVHPGGRRRPRSFPWSAASRARSSSCRTCASSTRGRPTRSCRSTTWRRDSTARRRCAPRRPFPPGRVLALNDVVGSEFGYADSIGELTILGAGHELPDDEPRLHAGRRRDVRAVRARASPAPTRSGPARPATANGLVKRRAVPHQRRLHRGLRLPGLGQDGRPRRRRRAARDDDALGAGQRHRARDRHRRRPRSRRDVQLPRRLHGRLAPPAGSRRSRRSSTTAPATASSSRRSAASPRATT